MGQAARFARSGQGIGVVRGESAGAKVSRGATRGRPRDVVRDARGGDFIQIGPGASRQPNLRSAKEIGTNTAQADDIANGPAGAFSRPDSNLDGEPDTAQRRVGPAPFVVEPRELPAGHVLPDPPSPFSEASKTRLRFSDPAKPKAVAGVTFGNTSPLSAGTAQNTSRDAGAMGRRGSFGSGTGMFGP